MGESAGEVRAARKSRARGLEGLFPASDSFWLLEPVGAKNQASLPLPRDASETFLNRGGRTSVSARVGLARIEGISFLPRESFGNGRCDEGLAAPWDT